MIRKLHFGGGKRCLFIVSLFALKATFTDATCTSLESLLDNGVVAIGHSQMTNGMESLMSCSEACARFKFYYGAVEDGKFCFCMNSDSGTPLDASSCSSTCVTGTPCGGPDGALSFFGYNSAAGGPPYGLASIEVPALTEVKTSISATVNSSGNFSIDWGDGTTRLLNGLDHTYHFPGSYTVTVFLLDSPLDSLTSIARVQDAPTLDVECPDAMTIGESQSCNATINQGFDYRLEWQLTNSSKAHNHTAPIPQPNVRMVGSLFTPDVDSTLPSSTNEPNPVILADSKILVKSEIIRVKSKLLVVGDFGLYAATPKCLSGVYCGAVDGCVSQCFTLGYESPLTCSNHLCSPLTTCMDGVCPTGTVVSGEFTFSFLMQVSATDLDHDEELPVPVVVDEGSLIAVGCLEPQHCPAPASIARRQISLEEMGDQIPDTSDHPDGMTLSNSRLLVQVVLREHLVPDAPLTVVCDTPAPIPVSDVPSPYSASTESFVFRSDLSVVATVLSETIPRPASITKEIICQQEILPPTLTQDLWVKFGEPYEFPIVFTEGAPLFSVVDTEGDLFYSYMDNALGSWTLTVPLNFANEGLALLIGNTSNAINSVVYSAVFHVAPPVTDNWVLDITCPCFDIEEGFPFLLTLPEAPHPPWNASFSATYQDSQPLFPQDVADFGTVDHGGLAVKLTIQKTAVILESGEWEVTAILQNEVSSTTLTKTVIVEEGIRDVTASMLFNNSGEIMPGFGESNNIFLVNSEIFFYPKSRTVNPANLIIVTGSPLQWKMTILENEETIEIPFEEKFTKVFAEYQELSVIISGYNTVQGWVNSPVIHIGIVSSMSGFRLMDDRIIRKPNEIREIIGTFVVFTPLTCIKINFGDGSDQKTFGNEEICKEKYSDIVYQGPSSVPVIMPHIYSEEGQYEVFAVAFDRKVTILQQLAIVVGDYPCTMPFVEIMDGARVVDMAPPYLRSKWLRLQSETKFECEGSFSTNIEWRITMLDPKLKSPILDFEIKDIISSWNMSTLSLPPLFLQYGVYKIEFIMRVIPSLMDTLARTDYCYINVVPTPLRAVIIAGSPTLLSRGFGQMLDLFPGTLSIDPDYPDDLNLNMTLWCIQKSPKIETIPMMSDGMTYMTDNELQAVPPSSWDISKTDRSGCFGLGPGAIALPESKNLRLDTSVMSQPNGTFEFYLEVQKETRIANASVTVKLTPEPPPAMSIRCKELTCYPSHDGLLINPSKKLALSALCEDACLSDLTYEWIISTKFRHGVDESSEMCSSPSQDGGEVVDMSPTDCQETFLNGKYSQDLIVTPVFFENNKQTDEFIFRITGATKRGTGFSEILLKVNHPPKHGRCEISEREDDVWLSVFPVTCSGWVDREGHLIKKYLYYYWLDSEAGKIHKIITSTSSPSFDLIMPNGYYDIYVDISDEIDAFTTYHIGNITVQKEGTLNMTAVLDEITYLSAISDQSTLIMALLSVNAHNRGPNSSLSLDPSTIANLTNEELMEKVTEITNLKNQQLQMLLEKSTFSDVEDLNTVSTILQDTFANVFDNPLNALTIDMKSKNTTIEVLEKMVSELENIATPSPDDLTIFLGNTLDVASNVIKSINEILENNLGLVPPTDRQGAEDWDYDTAIDEDFTMPNNMDMMVDGNVIATTRSKSEEQIDRILSVVDKINKAIQKVATPGEVIKAQSSNGAYIMVMKIRELGLQPGLTLDAKQDMNSWVQFPPNFCPSRYEIPDTDCNQIIDIKFTIMPFITYAYPETRRLLSTTSHILDIDVDLDYHKVNIKSEARPILLSIPQKESREHKPIYVNVSEAMNNILPFVYHTFNISNPDSAYLIEIKPVKMPLRKNLILMIDHERLPTLSQHKTRVWVNKLPIDNNGTYSYFVNNKKKGNHTGRFFAAIAALNPTASFKPLPRKLGSNDFASEWDEDYTFRAFTSACYFFKNSSRTWSGERLQVVSMTSHYTTCQTHHLTTFGSGYTPAVNSIDFQFVFANVGFVDNLTLYLVLAILTGIFILMLLWGHFMDRQDLKRRGVTPFPDNDHIDRYVYELTFYTGADSEASTDSNINIILSGDFGETNIRTMPDANGKLYRRFGVDSFVMTTPRPLGPLRFLRVFHDNCGEPPLDSWQLQMVVVRDLQLSEKYVFDTNSWLSLSRDDGKIDQIFAAEEEMDEKNFSQSLYIRGNKAVNEDHMWMAMFLRSNGSRFSRKERVLVCGTFLYLSLLVSGIWYDSDPESSRGGLFNLGPFTLSAEQGIIGSFVVFIVYPFVCLSSFVFKRARPKNLKRCRALHSIEQQREEQLLNKGVDKSEAEVRSKVETNPKRRPKPKDKSPVKCLPWWTRTIAWLVLIVSIAGSIFLVWSYGIMWGEIKTAKWFSSFIFCFFISILISQWIKVVLFSLISSIITKTDLSTEDLDCDEEVPALKQDEEWLHLNPLDPSKQKWVHKVEGVDIKNEEISALRTRMMKEREIKFVLRGIFVYCIFLAVLTVLISGRTEYSTFLLQTHLTNTFIKRGHPSYDFSEKIKTANDWWFWAKEVILQELRAQREYNNVPAYGLKGYLNDRANRIMGYAIIRQIRGRTDHCSVPEPLDRIIGYCSGTRGMVNEESTHFCAGWTLNETFPGSCDWEEFKYKSASKVGTYPYNGNIGMYSGGGYVFPLSGHQGKLLERMDKLHQNYWLNKQTRALILEFSVYNTNVNLFCICTIVAEFNEGGGVVTKWRFDPIRLLKEPGIEGFITSLCEILFLIFITFFTLRELWLMKKMKLDYFASYWNLAEVCILLVSYATIALYVYRSILTMEALEIFNETNGNGYVRMDSAAFYNELFLYFAAFICFFSTLKIIKLLQFNKRMDVLALTIRRCWEELKIFFIAFGILFFGFSCLFFFMFTAVIQEFSKILSAITTSFAMMMGKFDFEEMKQENPLSPLLFFIFSLSSNMILINIMLTIILQAFNEVKIDLEKKQNRLDVIDHVWSSLRQFLRLESLPRIHVNPVLEERGQTMTNSQDSSQQLPNKVSELLTYVNNLYFEGKLNMKDPQTKTSFVDASTNSLSLKITPESKKGAIFESGT